MKRVLLVLAGVASVAALACGDPPKPQRIHHPGSRPSTDSVGTPGWIVDQFFGWNSFPGEKNYVTGQFPGMYESTPPSTIGSSLVADATVSSRVVAKNDTNAVYATTTRAGSILNEYYTFLARRNNRWMITAVRNLDLSERMAPVIDSLRKLRTLGNAPPTLLGVIELMSSTDSAVKEYYKTHAAALASLTQAFNQQDDRNIFDFADPIADADRKGKGGADPHANIRRLMDAVYISRIFRLPQFPGCTFLLIGGNETMQVGYIYAASKDTKLPKMTPNEFIYIDAIESGWFEYKVR